MMIVKSAGAGLTWKLATADLNNDIVWRIINIDQDRYGGAYSGVAFTAWPGWRPDDIRRWSSITDMRVFCSDRCIIRSQSPEDVARYQPDQRKTPMTHEELDRLGPELQKRCNNEIARRFPTWSRYAVDQMLDQTMSDLAPDWGWMKVSTVNGVPQIRLMQYHGIVQPHGGSDGY